MHPAVFEYRSDVKLDRKVYHVVVPELRAYECASCGEQLIGDQADQQIDDALRDAAGLLRASEIRRCRKALGLKQRELAEMIGSSPEALCRWERGLVVQGRLANRLLVLAFESIDARQRLREFAACPRSLCEVAIEAQPRVPNLKYVDPEGWNLPCIRHVHGSDGGDAQAA